MVNVIIARDVMHQAFISALLIAHKFYKVETTIRPDKILPDEILLGCSQICFAIHLGSPQPSEEEGFQFS